ncbi:peptide chain release factor family protein [Priestia abyssalis]|uniref:peptide chain release factor family protein n=1 Tax=Priestia abyssalis TaxID=1221450 RepID=UPI000994B417|nr:hypothetical protein [Priestia abyssalis]
MDVKIEFAGQEKGTIPYASLPVFRLLFNECGFQVRWDEENRKIHLYPGLSGKIIFIAQNDNSYPHAFRKGKLEWEMLEHIQHLLAGSGAEVVLQKNSAAIGQGDLRLKLSVLEIPSIKKPVMDVSHDLKANNQKWLTLLQDECRKAGIQFSSNVDVSEISPHLTVQFKYPQKGDSVFWSKFKENSAIMLVMGILARLQGNHPLSVLSYLPFEHLPIWGKDLTKAQQTSATPAQTTKSVPKNRESAVKMLREEKLRKEKQREEKTKEEKRTEAEIFFDYQVLLDKNNSEKVMVLGNLHIKNTGTEVLRNPSICLRLTPAESIKISGQILPPNVANVRGVMNDEGVKGWKYMNDEWLDEAQEKGETWICPIQQLNIPPRQIESFQNFQISILKPEEHKNMKIEAFVFFREQGLECAANNQIALSF